MERDTDIIYTDYAGIMNKQHAQIKQ